MRTVRYPSQKFLEQFNSALESGAAFRVLVTSLRKRLAIARTINRLSGQPVNDKFLVSIADKIQLWDLYPCLGDALLNHHFSVEQDVLEGHMHLTFQPSLLR
jgi:hypothetical protein